MAQLRGGTAALRVKIGRWCWLKRDGRVYVGSVHSKRLKLRSIFCCSVGMWQRRGNVGQVNMNEVVEGLQEMIMSGLTMHAEKGRLENAACM